MSVPPPPPPRAKPWEYRLVTVPEARRLANQGWGPVPLVETVQDQTRGFVGSTTYVWIRKLEDA